MNKFLFSILLSFLFLGSFAQIPAGYYDAAIGKTGYELKSALHTIITNGHNDKGYTALYTGYVTGDTDPEDGFVWDMYSENPTGADPYNFSHGQAQCGNYSNEGDCYNREHLMPQSVFNEASPMRNDFFHVVPSDGKVNGIRSNYPFGEVGNASTTSLNGSQLGSCSSPGYSGTVFEPIDEFKGDIARALLYFGTRYETQVDSWSHEMLNGTENQVFSSWFLAVLLKWNAQDPVSTKETVRNNAGYTFQGNRNPFVDHPEWVECIWNNNCSGLSFTSTAITSGVQSVTYTYNITLKGDEGKTLSLTGVTVPSWLTLTQNTNTTATLTGTPTPNNLGANEVSLKLSDGTNEVFQNFTITVSDGNSLAFTSTPALFAKEGVEYSYTITTIGNDGKTLDISATTLPTWLTLSASKSSTATKVLRGTPTISNVGTSAVDIQLTDGTKTLHQIFDIKVSDASAVGSLIISQYYEGSSGNNKFIEITNVGDAAVDLSDYFIGRWSGTSTPSGAYLNGSALTGTIAAGGSKVYKNSASDVPSYAIATATGTDACYFNGDDPVALMKGGNTWADRVDCIYAAGTWGADKGFYRKSNVLAGNLNISVLDGSGEWVTITETAAQNATATATEYIGYHVFGSTGFEKMDSEFKIYPNPAQNLINIESKVEMQSLEIRNITGQLLKVVSVNGLNASLPISDLRSGVYFLQIINENNFSSSLRFVKQ